MKVAEQTEYDGWEITVHFDELWREGEPTRYAARADAIKHVRDPFPPGSCRLEIQYETVEFAEHGYSTSNEAIDNSIVGIRARIDGWSRS